MRRTLLLVLAFLLASCVGVREDGQPKEKDSSQVDDSIGRDSHAESEAETGDPRPRTLDCGLLSPMEPDPVDFRTPWSSFNQRWEASLQGGLIRVRELGHEEWELLGSTGLPEGGSFGNFGSPSEIVELSVDGVHLTALSDAGHFYRGSDMTTDVQWSFTWTDGWGGVGAVGPGMSEEFSTACGWSVSDSHPFGVASYEDTNGTVHSVGLGVAHVYRATQDGRHLVFNDWWLPPDWSRRLCGPERGTHKIVNLSVSASTLFVVTDTGQLYTRLYDFDTGGENPLLTYSYIVGPDSGTTRRLPAEDWLRQPDPPGPTTPRLTIFQDGQGNAARVLRVEAEDGYYEKHIYDKEWALVKTGARVDGPFFNPGAEPELVAPEDHALSGTLSLDADSVEIELADFNLVCSPAELRLFYGGEEVTARGEPLLLELHYVPTMVQETRDMDFREAGLPDNIQAALLIPDRLDEIDDGEARSYLQELFRDAAGPSAEGFLVLNFLGQASLSGLSLTQIMWDEPFRVPAEEKGFWSPFSLSAGL